MTATAKQRLIIALLFCLLGTMAAAPIMLLDRSSAQLINAVHAEAMSSGWEILPPSGLESFDSFQRILTIKSSLALSSDMVVSMQEDILSGERTTQLAEKAKEQLLILQQADALPSIDLSGGYRPIILRRSYMDMQNPDGAVSILRVQLHYADYYVDVYMDADAWVLYDVSITAREGRLLYSSDVLSPEGFLEYLESTSDGREKNGEVFDVMAMYDKRAIRLFVFSRNRQTGEITQYNFEDVKLYDWVKVSGQPSEYFDPSNSLSP